MKIETIDLTDRRNIYFVGDVHGDWKALCFLLESLKFNYRDAIICVGDLIDRGPHNLEVVNFFLNTPNAWAVRGNHEDMLIQGALHGQQNQLASHLCNGGEWILDMPQVTIEGFAKLLEDNLPVALRFRHENTTFGVTHAEMPVDDWEMFEKHHIKSGRIQQRAMWGRGNIKGKGYKHIKGIDFTIHGHSVRKDVTTIGNQWWIDTGSVFDTGSGDYGLSCIEFLKDKKDFEVFTVRRQAFQPNKLEMI